MHRYGYFAVRQHHRNTSRHNAAHLLTSLLYIHPSRHVGAPLLMQRPWASYLAVDRRGRVTTQPLPTPQALRSLEQQGRVHNLGGGWVMPVSDWDVASAKPHQGDGKCTHAAATPPARGCTDATQQAGTGSLDLVLPPQQPSEWWP
jgi:hypothetical protein